MARQLIAFLFRDRSWSVVLGPGRLRVASGSVMLFEREPKPAIINVEAVSSRSAGSFSEFFKVFEWIIASSCNNKFLFVDFYHKASRFLVECLCSSDEQQQRNNKFLHFLGLLFLCVSLLNVDTFSACSPADCNLYESSYYQGCSPTTGNNQYQCGGGSGSCSDVCGGCGWRIRTSGYLQQFQSQLDSLCALKLQNAGLACSQGSAKCTGLRPLRTIAIGLCGVGYESDFDVETICTCVERSSSSSAPSSSSSEPSSSSSFRTCLTGPGQTFMCNRLANGSTDCWNLTVTCQRHGYFCGGSWDFRADDSPACWVEGFAWVYGSTGTQLYKTYAGCYSNDCLSSSLSSSSISSSSSGSSSDSGGGDSSDSGGGGDSQSGLSSSGSGGSSDGDMIPCGWGDWPPCIVDPIDPPFCQQYPELCYQIGGIDDTISRYGSAIVDSLGRLIGRLDSLDLGGAGSCLDSADCPAADWSGDSVGYVAGDSAYSGSGSGDGGASSWLRSILSAASIPAASRSCPAFPTAEVNLPGSSSPYVVNFDICSERWYIAGHHPAELIGLFFRAVACLVAVFIVLGSLTSLNGGFAKMRLLGK